MGNRAESLRPWAFHGLTTPLFSLTRYAYLAILIVTAMKSNLRQYASYFGKMTIITLLLATYNPQTAANAQGLTTIIEQKVLLIRPQTLDCRKI